MTTAGQDVVGLLGRVPVFETLGQDDLERVAQVAVSRRFALGQVIFREGDESDTCYVVAAGVIVVTAAALLPVAVLALLAGLAARTVRRRRREAALDAR